jgi:hypothetical protein
MMHLQPGDILLTRNAGGEDQNRSPGWFNHAAMYVGDGIVVEAQMHVADGKWTDDTTQPGGVIESDVDEFLNRYPIIRVRRLRAGAEQAAEEAKQMVGLGYNRMSSWFMRQRRDERGVNCVAVNRRAVTRATGADPGWRRPDDIDQSRRLVTVDEKGFGAV